MTLADQDADDSPAVIYHLLFLNLVAWAQADNRNSYHPHLARVAGR